MFHGGLKSGLLLFKRVLDDGVQTQDREAHKEWLPDGQSLISVRKNEPSGLLACSMQV